MFKVKITTGKYLPERIATNKDFVQKLKDDQRAVKADLAVIVSIVLPEEVKGKGFVFRDGVCICDVKVYRSFSNSA